MSAQWENSRNVIERVYVEGELQLQTPAHFGNGSTEALTDVPLLRDSVDPTRPLLTGASIAGALRNYLREHELGYGMRGQGDGQLLSEALFGYLRDATQTQNTASVESWLMVDDALGTPPTEGPAIEIRDGVAIDPETKTAKIDHDTGHGQKFDVELLTAGTTFTIRFELWVHQEKSSDLVKALAWALKGFENGRIGLGLRKRRGYGQSRVADWKVWRYSMQSREGIIGWLTHSYQADRAGRSTDILELLEVEDQGEHKGEAFVLRGTFRLRDSLLIRSDSGDPNGPDMVHLRSHRPGADQPIPVVSGTSLAGVIRARALRIANTLNERKATDLVVGMFGQGPEDGQGEERREPSGSRVWVYETPIKDSIRDRVQSRVKIDRFTGGAYPQALFSQQPVFARTNQPTQIEVHLELRKRADTEQQRFYAEIGLLLLVLKDLWTGDLPIGGESSIGRGRLQGQQAILKLSDQMWRLRQTSDNGRLAFEEGSSTELDEKFLQALKDWLEVQ